MNLFIQPIGKQIDVYIEPTPGWILSHFSFETLGNEFELFLDSLLIGLKNNNISWDDISKIGIVSGPGSFTAMRVITLTLNTLAFTFPHITLVPFHFFEVLALSGLHGPYCIKANRWQYCCRNIIGDSDILHDIIDVPSGHYYWHGDENDFEDRRVSIEYTLRIENIFAHMNESEWKKRIDPLYIKKPNITTPKPRT